MKKKHTKESLIQCLHDHHHATGNIPGRGNSNIPRGSIYVRVFGSWANALSEAGFDQTRKDQILERQNSDEKLCSKCGKLKDSDAFTKQFVCDDCRTSYSAEWYRVNKPEQHRSGKFT